MSNKKVFFTAGPATQPDEVMKIAHDEFKNYNGLGISVLEISHRSKQFLNIIEQAEHNFKKLLQIPDNYSVFFMQGGALLQFDAIPLNFCSRINEHSADYIVDGYWSKTAAEQAKKYVDVKQQVFDGNFKTIPSKEDLIYHQDASYRYFCDNETIQGLEFDYVPHTGYSDQPLVCDMTSNFLSRPVDVEKFGVIFASAQKNCGTSGLCISIVRNDLIGNASSLTPTLMNYKVMRDNKSIKNTPPTYAIYMANLCAQWVLKEGGLEKFDDMSKKKSSLVYDSIEKSNGFYISPVNKNYRSRMNVVFLLSKPDLLAKFIAEAEIRGLYELKGHRSVGGLRASLYNGITLDDVQRLVEFMDEFRDANSDS